LITLEIESKIMNVLQEAEQIIYGDRETTYGSPDKNLKVIASYWTTHLNASYGKNLSLTVDDVCVMMMLLKQARLANSPKHRDSLVDVVGYAALKDRCDQLVVASAVSAVDVPVLKRGDWDNIHCELILCQYPNCSCSPKVVATK
jgi:hypothetical protein